MAINWFDAPFRPGERRRMRERRAFDREEAARRGMSEDDYRTWMEGEAAARGMSPREYRRVMREGRGEGGDAVDLARSGVADVPTDDQLNYDPQYEDSLNKRFQLGQSQEARAAADPRDLRAQRQALEYFQGVQSAGGWTPTEAMQLQQAGLEAAQLERGQREALQQQAAARGMAGGGQELMGSLAAQQGGANRAHDWATQIATEGQRRAFEAAQQAGAMSSAMRGQGFDESRARGAAADEFTRSNVDYARGSEERNVGRTNEARQRRADVPLMTWQARQQAREAEMAARSAKANRNLQKRQMNYQIASDAINGLGSAIGGYGGRS